jgi:hypothetical protein
MPQATKDERRRDRLRDYDARLAAARESVTVLAQFAQAREARGASAALEAEFAAVEIADAAALPAAAWIALRHGDVGSVVEMLVLRATDEFVVAEHEELGADYRLTTVTERRGLPDVDVLITQVAAFLDVPRDVLAMICGWGPEDPRTQSEVERLIDERFGVRSVAARPDAAGTDAVSRLHMSDDEFAAVLSLTPEQQGVLSTLVRQADIVVRDCRGVTR